MSKERIKPGGVFRAADKSAWTLLASEDDYNRFHAIVRATNPAAPTAYPCFAQTILLGDDATTYEYLTAGELAIMAEANYVPQPGDDTRTRRVSEVVRAHDILVAVVTGEIDLGRNIAQSTGLRGALDVLCWVLMHEHNQTFAENIENIEAAAEARGYSLAGIEAFEGDNEDELEAYEANASLQPDPREHGCRRCRVCGCTDASACPGGCWWVALDLCSRCAPVESMLVLPR